MMYGVRTMSMSFQYRQEVDLETARRLVVFCVEEYLASINADREIRPYLVNYPFTEKDVEIRIFFCKPDGHKIPAGGITVTSAIDGMVNYETNTVERNRLVNVHKEVYETALELSRPLNHFQNKT